MWKELGLSLLPGALLVLIQRLRDRDSNVEGADDAFADVLAAAAPHVPEMIAGRVPATRAADRAMTAIHAAAANYLRARGLLPGGDDCGA